MRVDKKSPTDCWNWLGPTRGTNTYGVFWCAYKKYQAHKVAYNLTFGPVEDGKIIMHLCDNKLCCNPEHLSQGSQLDNMRDMGQMRQYKKYFSSRS